MKVVIKALFDQTHECCGMRARVEITIYVDFKNTLIATMHFTTGE